jgi:hypothetical protein
MPHATLLRMTSTNPLILLIDNAAADMNLAPSRRSDMCNLRAKPSVDLKGPNHSLQRSLDKPYLNRCISNRFLLHVFPHCLVVSHLSFDLLGYLDRQSRTVCAGRVRYFIRRFAIADGGHEEIVRHP